MERLKGAKVEETKWSLTNVDDVAELERHSVGVGRALRKLCHKPGIEVGME